MTSLQSVALSARATGLTLARAERVLLALTVLAAAGMMWLAPRLPMIDVPQHAAQVALWRDLLLGQSPWSEVVRINLFTPYLIGYGLMLPLSFVFSMEVTTRLVLTLAFLAFVALCMALRRQFGADRRLDWLFVLSFFGMCWKWGFLTFLVSSPVFLLFLLLAARHAQDPGGKRSLMLVLAGTFLLFSHGLLFLAALFLGGLLMLEQVWAHRGEALVARFLPYVVLSVICIGFRLATQQMEGAMQNHGFTYGTPLWQRPLTWLIHITDAEDHDNVGFLQLATAAALCAPLLYGLRLNRRAPLVLLAGLFAILCIVPANAFETGGLFYRFALFLPPFIAFAFRAPAPMDTASARSFGSGVVLAASCWLVLGMQGSRIAAFAQESKPFETVLAAAQPGKRALALILDEDSPAAVNERAYGHWGLWYQAEKHGFVDFNFAFFPPQVIRFRPDHKAIMDEEERLSLGQYVWPDRFINQYTYVFVRGSAEKVELVKKMSRCPLAIVANDGLWFLLERGACPG